MTSLHADEAYLGHYQFSHDPFAPRVPGFKFFPAQRKPVLGQLHHLARYSQLLLLICGQRGSGKTLLRQALVASTNKQTVQSVVASPRSASGSVLQQIAEGLGVAQPSVGGVLAQVAQLALVGQEAYLLVDDAEQLDDLALAELLALAVGNAEGRPHVFLFGQSSLIPRLERLSAGEERFHAIELQPYSEEETREYLAQRLEGAGQGIELLTAEQIEDIHQQSGGWPGAINEVARDMLVEIMLARQGAARGRGFALGGLPVKHLLALLVVAVGVGAAWLMQGDGGREATIAPVTTQLPMNPAVPAAPATAVQESEGPAIEFDGAAQPLPLPLVGEAQPVIRQPLAQAASLDEEDGREAVEELPVPVAVAPAPAPAPVPTPAPAPVAPVVPVAAPAVAPASKPAPVAASVGSPAAKPVASAQPDAVSGNWYRSQSSSNYALQIFGSRSESSAQALVRELGGESRYFKKMHQGQPLFVVTYGSFGSRDAAQAAIKSLPAKVQAGKPWPRTFASIQQEAL